MPNSAVVKVGVHGMFAIVDPGDLARVGGIRWNEHRVRGRVYARALNHGGTPVYMHRLINRTPSDMMTDHVNGNGLDNRRSNLRSATNAQNMANLRQNKVCNTSGHTGVSRRNARWRAYIVKDYRQRHLGYFATPEAAALAYNAAARELFGEFAFQNTVGAGDA